MIEILIEVPGDFRTSRNPADPVTQMMQKFRAIWTGDPQPGTRIVGQDENEQEDGTIVRSGGRKLIVAKVQASLDELEQAIAAFGYDWKILGAKGDAMIRTPLVSDVLPFMPDVPITDSEGNVTGYERPTEPRVGIYAGSIPWEYV